MIKRITALLLCLVLLLTGCAKNIPENPDESGVESTTSLAGEQTRWEDFEPQFSSLDDERLLAYIEDLVYRDTVLSLNSDKYLVENVSAVYISKEYLEEVVYNSQPNIYFGYTIAELDEVFQGAKYVFTVSEDGTTIVQKVQEIEDVSDETIMKNIAIGTGVILLCVTVSVVTGGIGAPAVSAIFAASATTATEFAISSAVIGGLSAGIVRGVETGDFNEAMEAAALGASEGFKWGAISGAVVGGAKEAFWLKTATKGGLKMNEAAIIQSESALPNDVISEMRNFDEYLVYKEAGLKPAMVNGRTALVQDIDLNYVSELGGEKVTNRVRMQKGHPPIEPATGEPYQLHHIGQKNDGTLAVLTKNQHTGNGNNSFLHSSKKSEIDRIAFEKTKKEFWQYVGNFLC